MKVNLSEMWHNTPRRGETNFNAKLCNDQVIAIKKALEAKSASVNDLATKYGVSPKTIQGIRTGHRWGWLNIDP